MNDSRRDLDQPGKVTVKRSGPDRGNACDVAGIGRALLTHVYLVFFGRLVPYSEGHRAESQEGSSCNLVSHGFRCRSVVVSDTHHKPLACDLLEDAGIAASSRRASRRWNTDVVSPVRPPTSMRCRSRAAGPTPDCS